MKISQILREKTRALKISREQGAAFLLAVIATLVLAVMGGTFAYMLDNEARSNARRAAFDQALFVAESGVEDVFYQRTKNQSDVCFPYTDDGTLTGAAGAINGAASGATCDGDPDTDADVADPDKDDIPCWPFNEKLYANSFVFGPNFYCNDGSDSVKCPTYRPLASWPADPSGGVGWKDMDATRAVPLPNTGASSGQRYTTGLFTVCNDNFVGDDTTVEPAKSAACLSPPCTRRVFRMSVVSVGEVQTRPGETVQRAVKVDFIPPVLYAGTIDKYIDLTLMYETNINGPIHINGWWNANQNRYDAFLLVVSASFAPLMAMFDPPELVSVSYPEDPANPDWQPPIALGGQVIWVHLPVRLEIPEVNWSQFENRMNQLYADALGFYGSGSVHRVRMEDYDPANMYNTNGNGIFEPGDYRCGNWLAGTSTSTLCDECREMVGALQWCEKGNNCAATCCAENAGDGRIHNCRGSGYQQWSNIAFDLYNFNTGSWVTGTEPGHLGGGAGPRDRSLRYISKTYFELHLGGGCSLSNPLACLTTTLNRPQFVFMGRHEFAGKVFIDGTMGIGTRTPYHTCGPGDGSLSIYCVSFTLFGLCIGFGFPHWHTGNARITGELLVNGKLFMADYIRIDGGALYADDHIIKDETSGFDITLNLQDLICLLIGGITWICDAIFAIVGPIIQAVFPWWPTIDLSNLVLFGIDLELFKTYLDIDGWNMANVINSGTMYTRGDFRYEEPGFDLAMWGVGMFIDWLLGFGGINIGPALDPVRIWNYGAIVAGGTQIAPGVFRDGNIFLGEQGRLDILTHNPDTDTDSTGYVFARGSLQVHSDIISHYGGGGAFQNCTGFLGLDADCAASGIFYSGGVTAGTNPTSMFTSEGGTLNANGGFKDYKITCLNPDEPGFWPDVVDQALCWGRKIPIACGIIPGGNCDVSEFNIRGYVFAGQVGGMPQGNFRLDQDSSVLHPAVQRRYYRNLSGLPIDWMEIEPPANIPKLGP